MIFVAILAGGKGTRVGTKVPKQFLEIGGKPIIIRTIDVFVKSKLVDIIYVSVNEMWIDYTKEILQKYYNEKERKLFRVVCGGKERMMTMLNVLYDIRDNFGINDADIFLTHDAVRPFVTQEIIEDCIEKTKVYDVAMASIQSAETTYAMQKEGFLSTTYDRTKLYYAQTPQGSRMDIIYDVINSYSEKELLSMTGTSQLFINRGMEVKISLGDPSNMKITTMKEVDFATYLIEKGNSNEL